MTSEQRREVVMPFRFAEALEAAGLIHDRDRISEIVIRAKPTDVVTIEVTYIADERIYMLAKPKEAARDPLAAKLTALGVPPGEQAMYAHAIQQDPGWRERLPAVTTREQLDHYTETGAIAP
jgi:hypothetical protein